MGGARRIVMPNPFSSPYEALDPQRQIRRCSLLLEKAAGAAVRGKAGERQSNLRGVLDVEPWRRMRRSLEPWPMGAKFAPSPLSASRLGLIFGRTGA